MVWFVQFKGGRQIELNYKGKVLKGTLNKDTKLRSPEGSQRFMTQVQLLSLTTVV
jgi:hypothetical protein